MSLPHCWRTGRRGPTFSMLLLLLLLTSKSAQSTNYKSPSKNRKPPFRLSQDSPDGARPSTQDTQSAASPHLLYTIQRCPGKLGGLHRARKHALVSLVQQKLLTCIAWPAVQQVIDTYCNPTIWPTCHMAFNGASTSVSPSSPIRAHESCAAQAHPCCPVPAATLEHLCVLLASTSTP